MKKVVFLSIVTILLTESVFADGGIMTLDGGIMTLKGGIMTLVNIFTALNFGGIMT
jgi:hypothetical protein